MNSKLISPRFLVLCAMILAAAFTRLIPHLPNFTAIGAMALFGGAYFSNKKIAFAVPLIAMFITDLILGFHNTMIAVYIAFALMVVIGMTMIKRKKAGNIVLAAVTATVFFFIITNFAIWLSGIMYPMTGAGLVECYIAAIPFFGYNIAGNLFYSGVMFGLFELARMKFPQLAPVKS